VENFRLIFPHIKNTASTMTDRPKFKPDPRLKLMDQVRQALRYHHYAYRTEQTYCDWIVRYIKHFGAKRHPKEMGKAEIEAFLSHLATVQKVYPSTQRQALNAIVCDPHARRWSRHPSRPGTDGSCRHQDNRNLNPRDAKRYRFYRKSVGYDLALQKPN